MKIRSVVLDPKGPFSELPRSDTLFGAICWGLRHARGEAELETYLEQFADGNPPFLVSSVFPVVELKETSNGKTQRTTWRMLPKPKLPATQADEKVSSDRLEAIKQWKDIEYLPLKLFKLIAEGKPPVEKILALLENGHIKTKRNIYEEHDGFLLPTCVPVPLGQETRVRNAVDRLTGKTEGALYQEERLFFTENAKLHCLVGMVNKNAKPVVEALEIISDRGLGGGRSTGSGQFSVEGYPTKKLPDPDTNHFCSLSMCIPGKNEIDTYLSEGYYELETRKGVIEGSLAGTNQIWKRRVLALAEGAVLPGHGVCHGHNPIVADHFENGVQQYGYAFPVGLSDDHFT